MAVRPCDVGPGNMLMDLLVQQARIPAAAAAPVGVPMDTQSRDAALDPTEPSSEGTLQYDRDGALAAHGGAVQVETRFESNSSHLSS